MDQDNQTQPSAASLLAMQQEIIDLVSQKLDWRIRAIDLQREVDDLKKQIADLHSAESPAQA